MEANLILDIGSWVASGLLTIGLWGMRMLHNQVRDLQARMDSVAKQYVTESRVKELIDEKSGYKRDRQLIDHRLTAHDSDIAQLKKELGQIRQGQERLQGSLDQLIQMVQHKDREHAE